jgi:inhibitor of the pro-sigma K processing machinery
MVTVAYIFGTIILYIAIFILYKPLKFIFRLAFHAALGCSFIYCTNLLLAYYGLSIGINAITGSIAGIFGVPGLAVLAVAQKFFIL